MVHYYYHVGPTWNQIAAQGILQDLKRRDEQHRRHQEGVRKARADYEATFSDLYRLVNIGAAPSKVRELVKHQPEQICEAILDGDTPFLYVLRGQESTWDRKKIPDHLRVEYAKIMLLAYPKAARTRTSDGLLPLFFVLLAGGSVPVDLVRLLIDGYPSAASEITPENATALHVAARKWELNPQTRNLLFDRNPTAIQAVDNDGNYPLHVACRHSSAEMIEFLCQRYPNALRASNNTGNTVFHMLSSRDNYNYMKLDKGLYDYLISKTGSDALLIKNQEGNLPLHCAAGTRQPVELIRALTKHCPVAAERANKEGLYPLQIALTGMKADTADPHHGKHPESTKYLYQACPDICNENSFLKTLIRSKSSEPKQLAWVLTQRPELLQKKDVDGRLPLHLLGVELANPKIISGGREKANLHALLQVCVAKYPQALHVRDHFGRTPYEYSCAQQQQQQQFKKWDVFYFYSNVMNVAWLRDHHSVKAAIEQQHMMQASCCFDKSEKNKYERRARWLEELAKYI